MLALRMRRRAFRLLDVADVQPGSRSASPGQKSEAHRSGQELTLLDVADVDLAYSFDVDCPLLHARDEGHRDVGSTDLFAEVQDEQLRMFEGMDHFMYHVRLQLDRHRKEVEMHQFRQLGLLRGISEAGISNADVIRGGDVGSASPQARSMSRPSLHIRRSSSRSPLDDANDATVSALEYVPERPPHRVKNSRRCSQKGSRRLSDVSARTSVQTAIHEAYEQAMAKTGLAEAAFLTRNSAPTDTASLAYILWQLRTAAQRLQRWFLRRRLHLDGLKAVLDGWLFSTFVAATISANVVVLSLQTHHDITSSLDNYDSRVRGEPEVSHLPACLTVADVVFHCIFGVEILLRIAAYEGAFFLGHGSFWNLWDLCVISSTLLEHFLPSLGKMSMLRTISSKPSRFLRAARIIRFWQSVYPLRFLLLACKNAIPALCWASLLILILLTVSSVAFIGGAKAYIDSAGSSDAHVADLRDHFGSVPRCLLTLFVTFLGEADFKLVINLLAEIGWPFSLLYLAFILIILLIVSNVISGVFVAEAVDVAEQDREIRLHGKLAEARRTMKVLTNIFQVLDVHDTDKITIEDLSNGLHHPEVRELLAFFNVDVADADALFPLLDTDQSGHVSREEFVVACLRMDQFQELSLEVAQKEAKAISERILAVLERVEIQNLDFSQRLASLELSLDASVFGDV